MLPNVELRIVAHQHRHDTGQIGDLARGVIRLMTELNITTGELLEAAAEDIESSAWEIIGRVEQRKRLELP